MVHHHSARALAESIVHANSYREAHQQARHSADQPALTIAVSRQVGAGGTSIAAEVARASTGRSTISLWSSALRKALHLHTNLLESLDERHTHWLVESVESFSQVPRVSESAYVRQLIQTILSLGAHGCCVIVGRGAAHMLPPATTLRVRLVAERDDRVTALSRELGVPRDEANRRLDLLDRERNAFVKDHFLKDSRDPQNFDVVLNSSSFSYSECASSSSRCCTG